MNQAYYIGGSPCCGKSSIAKTIADRYNFKVYRLDDHVDDYMKIMSDSGNELFKRILSYGLDEMWMRDPEVLCDDEIAAYEGLFSYFQKDINELKSKSNVIAEGSGLLPKLVYDANVSKEQYICITPSRTFQTDKHSNRSWVKHYLASVENPETALSNWIERDVRYAQIVLRDAINLEYENIVVDGTKSMEENIKIVERVFKLV